MRQVWRWEFSEDFAVFEHLGALDGPREAIEAGDTSNWEPPNYREVRQRKAKAKPPGDFPGTTEFLHLISPRAERVVGEKFRKFGQLLSVAIGGHSESWFVFYPSVVVPCLNLEASKVIRMPWPPHRITSVLSPVFERSKVPLGGAFVVPECPQGEIYVCEDVVEVVENAGLEGFVLAKLTI